MTGFLSDAQLKYMYTHATAMIFASLMGPNNLPPIEAAFLGCPVIITDLKGHQEQLGEAALYFNGTSEEELMNCMIQVMDETVRTDLIRKETVLRESLAEIRYIEPVLKIIQEFEGIRRCWKP